MDKRTIEEEWKVCFSEKLLALRRRNFYYDGGVSYYKIMIKHDDSDKAMNEFGEFGVVCNSVYDINIKGFNNPGYPTIPDPDPDTPDENDETWLSIQINVNPWTWYSQEEIL